MNTRRLIVCLVLLLTGCGRPPSPGGLLSRLEVAGPARMARVGAAISLSGSMGEVGRDQQRGITLAQEEINASGMLGRTRLEIAIEDDGSDRDRATTVFQRLIENKHVLAIIGPTRSDIALLVDPMAQQAGVPVLAISNSASGITQIGNFVFRGCLSQAHVTPHLVNTLKHRIQLRTAALLRTETDPNRSGAFGFKSALTAAGVRLSTEETFAPDGSDLSEHIQAIAASRPDALFVAAPPHWAAAILTQTRNARGLERVPIVGTNAFDSNAVIADAGPAAEGLIVGGGWSSDQPGARNQQFTDSYRARYGVEPDTIAAQAYTSIYLIAAGLQAAHTTNNPRALRDALEQLSNIDTPLGPFTFSPEREPTVKPIVKIARDGHFVLY